MRISSDDVREGVASISLIVSEKGAGALIS